MSHVLHHPPYPATSTFFHFHTSQKSPQAPNIKSTLLTRDELIHLPQARMANDFSQPHCPAKVATSNFVIQPRFDRSVPHPEGTKAEPTSKSSSHHAPFYLRRFVCVCRVVAKAKQKANGVLSTIQNSNSSEAV